MCVVWRAVCGATVDARCACGVFALLLHECLWSVADDVALSSACAERACMVCVVATKPILRLIS